jgi:hypothetical protein
MVKNDRAKLFHDPRRANGIWNELFFSLHEMWIGLDLKFENWKKPDGKQ